MTSQNTETSKYSDISATNMPTFTARSCANYRLGSPCAEHRLFDTQQLEFVCHGCPEYAPRIAGVSFPEEKEDRVENMEEKKVAMTRKELLDKASAIVNGARDKSYGSPEDSFKCIGQMWNAYLGRRLQKKLAPSDVAAMMALLKIARISTGIYSEDSWIDLAGYAACGGECASFEQEDKET